MIYHDLPVIFIYNSIFIVFVVLFFFKWSWSFWKIKYKVIILYCLYSNIQWPIHKVMQGLALH